jgi:hypothetical protein
LKYDHNYYSEKSTLDRFLSQETQDDLEVAFIDNQLQQAISKVQDVVRKFSDKPEFSRRLAMELARRELDLNS